MVLLLGHKLVQSINQSFVLAVISRLKKMRQRNFCDSKENNGSKDEVVLPEEPQNCCMAGCANCVWVAYAEELAKILQDEGVTARQKIMENIKDPNLRTFILLELDHILKKK